MKRRPSSNHATKRAKGLRRPASGRPTARRRGVRPASGARASAPPPHSASRRRSEAPVPHRPPREARQGRPRGGVRECRRHRAQVDRAHGVRKIGGHFDQTEGFDTEVDAIVHTALAHGRADERFGVTRGQIVGADVRHVFHDHAVHHPKGLRSTVDRRGTAHTNLGSGTESSAHVLHRHTGRLPFERTTDVGHARKARFADVDLVGRARKEATVRLRHTRGHHYLAEALVVFEHDAHILAAFDGGRLHADVRHGDARVFAFDGEGKFTVVVGHGELFATDRGDVCTGDGLIVRSRDHNARHFGLRQRGGDTKHQTQQEGGQFFSP